MTMSLLFDFNFVTVKSGWEMEKVPSSRVAQNVSTIIEFVCFWGNYRLYTRSRVTIGYIIFP